MAAVLDMDPEKVTEDDDDIEAWFKSAAYAEDIANNNGKWYVPLY